MAEARRFRLFGRRAPAAPVLLEHGAVPWLLAVAAATTLPHFPFLPLWLSCGAFALIAGRAWLWQRNGRLPRRWLLALMVFSGAAAVAWHYRMLFGREPGVALLVFFMALKPMEMTRRRDALVIVMLGFFLLLTHFFNSEGLATGVWLLASAGLLTAALVRVFGGAQPIPAVFRAAFLLIAQSIPFMLILFVLFPRIQGPLWGMPRDAYAGLSGLTDQISPGALDKLILSGEIAFRARFAGPLPPRAKLYWRGPALDAYDGRTWRTSQTSRDDPARRPAAIEPAGEAVDYTITLEAHDRRWLLALDMPVALPPGASLSPALTALSDRPVRLRARFAFRSAPDYTANRDESPRLLRQALRLPEELNPRAYELAQSWRRAGGGPEAISARALRLFREEKFYYTLQPPRLGKNAVDEFLFETRRGFCEHYAGAYAALMRAAGVPARVVIGYQGGEMNPFDGFLTVRQSDAHAWAEIWIAGRGWRRVDPTAAVAPSRIEQGIDAALPEDEPRPALMRFDSGWLSPLRALRFRWEAVNNAWDQWVLGYNPERQRETLAGLGLGADWQGMVGAMAALCALSLLAVAVWALARRAPAAPEVRAWRRFCARLGRLGVSRQPWEGPLALADRAARERPALAPLARRAAAHYAELRYGNGTREDLAALRECVRELGMGWKGDGEKGEG